MRRLFDQACIRRAAELNLAHPTFRNYPNLTLYLAKAETAKLTVSEDRILVCAALLAAADWARPHNLNRGKTVPLFPHQELASWFCIPRHQADESDIRARYRKARQALQQIDQANKALIKRRGKLLSLFEKHAGSAPVQVISLHSEMREKLTVLDKLAHLLEFFDYSALGPTSGNLLNWKRDKNRDELMNVEQLALLWWHHWAHDQRWPQFWNDLFQLAQIWLLTSCGDPQEFRRVVLRLEKGVTDLPAPPGMVSQVVSLPPRINSPYHRRRDGYPIVIPHHGGNPF